MKLISPMDRPLPVRPRRSRFLIPQWIRAQSGMRRALFLKSLFVLLTAAIAIYAVHLLAHTMQVVEQSISK